MTQQPTPQILTSEFYQQWGDLLVDSFERALQRPLLDQNSLNQQASWIEALYEAPFALVSHGTEDDPVFNFANCSALDLFEMDWASFTKLPSRKSAQAVERAERARLLEQVDKLGYIADYSGVRISASGRRFVIEQAVVWNVLDEFGKYCGQAAVFSEWHYL